jgi:hypothetical protein
LCEKLKPESFKLYCSILNFHSSLREMYDMARRYRGVQRKNVGNFSWLPEFAEKMAPPLLTPNLSFRRRTSKLNWLVERFTIEELKSALGLCKNSSTSMNNVRFAHIRCLPECGLELSADSGGLEAYANCYDPETEQGPSIGALLPTDKSLIVYSQVVRTNAYSET